MKRKIIVNKAANPARKYQRNHKFERLLCPDCDLVCNPLFPPTKYRLMGWQCPKCLLITKAKGEDRNLKIQDIEYYDRKSKLPEQSKERSP